ncbi:MAG: hypothetical protein R2822_00145 [Spirosomataceae bacterium]
MLPEKSRFPYINDSTVNFNKAVADIEALRMVLRIPKWSVVAHGFGAKIACAYATGEIIWDSWYLSIRLL